MREGLDYSPEFILDINHIDRNNVEEFVSSKTSCFLKEDEDFKPSRDITFYESGKWYLGQIKSIYI